MPRKSFELVCVEVGGAVVYVSSRRRHTRCSRDWSSDVCSSDLSFSSQHEVLKQKIVPIAATRTGSSAPASMIQIPEGDFLFRVSGVEIEGSNDIGVDVQYPWEDAPRRFHEHPMHIKSFYIDKYPVTNVEFKQFLDATRYHPNDDLNFLRDWKDGTFPARWDHRPVTWVSIEDARAYATWVGKRLPHEWEWQYAAQGTDGRIYPWGNQWDEIG